MERQRARGNQQGLSVKKPQREYKKNGQRKQPKDPETPDDISESICEGRGEELATEPRQKKTIANQRRDGGDVRKIRNVYQGGNGHPT